MVTMNGNPVTDYDLAAKSGLLRRSVGWEKKSVILVTYTGGYVLEGDKRTLPYDLEFAAILWTACAYNSRGSEHLSDEAVGPLKSVFWQEQPAIRAIVGKYRRVNL